MNNRMNIAPIDRDFGMVGVQAAIDEAAKAYDAAFRPRPASEGEEPSLAAAVADELADSIPTDTTAITGDKVALERVLEKRRAHKRELQKLLSVTKQKLRQCDATIRGIEDHLDTLFECEA